MPTKSISRRALLTTAAGAWSCKRREPADGKIHLRFCTAGEKIEIATFRELIRAYQARRPDVVIELEEIGYRTSTSIEVELAAGVGPDVFRVQYPQVGRYSPSGAIIDLSPYLTREDASEFTDPVWAAVQYKGRPHALPQHTDTSAILYNKTIFRRLGISPPEQLADAWTWTQFIEVARALKRGGCEYAFAVNWTFGGAFRWLNFLYQNGGRLLEDDGRTPAIPSAAAVETLAWTKSFFTEKLVPPSDSSKSTEQIENLFATGIVGMYFDVGPESMQELHPPFDWGATFLPQKRAHASELGGNAIAVTRDSRHRDIAVDFALFLTNEANMRHFVTRVQFLPVRKKLLRERLSYASHADEMRVHLEQSTTVPVELARTVTQPYFYRIQRSLRDELDLTFTGGQAPEVTIEKIARDVRRSAEIA